MKITTTYLKQVIKEEIDNILQEEEEAEKTAQGLLDILNKEIEERPEVKKEIEENQKLNEYYSNKGEITDPAYSWSSDYKKYIDDIDSEEWDRRYAATIDRAKDTRTLDTWGGVLAGTYAGVGLSGLAVLIAQLSSPQLLEVINTLASQAIVKVGPGGLALATAAPIAIPVIIGALEGYIRGNNKLKMIKKNLSKARATKKNIKEAPETAISEKADPEKVDPKKFPMKLSQVDKNTAATNVRAGLEKYDTLADDDSIPVKHAPEGVSVKDLKPSQSSMNIGKALGMAISMINKAGPFKGGPGGDLGAFISNDKYIMDGHHRWISSFMVDPNAKIGGYFVDFPREQLIAVLNTMTKGAFGVEKGKSASGGFDQFAPGPIKAALRAFAKEGNEFTGPEDVVRAAEAFTGKKGAAAVDAAAEKFSANLINGKATLSVPADSPERPDMPVIDSKNIAKAVEMLTQGNVDINQPYGSKNLKPEPENVNESVVYDKWKKLIR